MVVSETEGSIAALRELLAAPATQGLTGDVSALLTEVEGLVAEVRESGLVQTANTTLVELQTTVNSVAAEVTPVLDEAQKAIASAQGSIDRVPGLLESLDALAETLTEVAADVNELPLDRSVANANALMASIDDLLNTPGVQALPDETRSTLVEARRVFTDLTEEDGLIDRANALVATSESSVAEIRGALRPVLAEAQRAAVAVADAADTAPEVADRAKRVADQIELLVDQAADLPIEEIGRRASALLDSANTLVSSPDTQRLPGALADSLEEAQRLLIQIQEGGLIENANQTLSSVRQAADRLPALLAQVSQLLNRTGTVVAGYEANGTLGTEVQSTLRDIQSAASSVDALARQLERSPNSLLFGR